MKKTEAKKLKLNLGTLRNLKPEELGKVVGGLWPTESQKAGGCEVTSATAGPVAAADPRDPPGAGAVRDRALVATDFVRDRRSCPAIEARPSDTVTSRWMLRRRALRRCPGQ
jgi:hypothetical protein